MSKDYENLQAEAAELIELINGCKAELKEEEQVTLPDILWESLDNTLDMFDFLDNPVVSTAGKALLINSATAGVVPVIGQAIAVAGIAAFAGGTIFELGKHALTKRRVEKSLLPYYEELTVKHMMLLQQHESLTQELINLAQDEAERRQELMADYQRQQALLKRIAESGLLLQVEG